MLASFSEEMKFLIGEQRVRMNWIARRLVGGFKRDLWVIWLRMWRLMRIMQSSCRHRHELWWFSLFMWNLPLCTWEGREGEKAYWVSQLAEAPQMTKLLQSRRKTSQKSLLHQKLLPLLTQLDSFPQFFHPNPIVFRSTFPLNPIQLLFMARKSERRGES